MSKYGQIAINAARAARSGEDPIVAWKVAAQEIFPYQQESRKKGCPKCAFLGLAEDGLIKGVLPGSYTTSEDNKRYAVNALHQIQADPSLAGDKPRLWEIVTNRQLSHNGQLDVVIDLWNNGDVS